MAPFALSSVWPLVLKRSWSLELPVTNRVPIPEELLTALFRTSLYVALPTASSSTANVRVAYRTRRGPRGGLRKRTPCVPTAPFSVRRRASRRIDQLA